MSATSATTSRILDVVQRYERDLLAEWTQNQAASLGSQRARIRDDELREQSQRFLNHLMRGLQSGGSTADIRTPAWNDAREFLGELSRARAIQGFSPTETALFVFSLKQPLFARLRQELGRDPELLADQL